MTQPWYPFYWADYSGKTHHLTMGQNGAYMLFLRWIYTSGKPIPHQQRYSIARAITEQERDDVDLVLTEFFIRKAGFWTNDKALEVIESAENRHKLRVQAGAKGGAAKAGKSVAMLEQCSTNQNHNQNQESIKPRPVPTAEAVNGSGFLNEGKGGWFFDPTDETLEKLRSAAPGWDRQFLCQKYRDFSKGREKPRLPQAAFLGWASKFTKGNPPP